MGLNTVNEPTFPSEVQKFLWTNKCKKLRAIFLWCRLMMFMFPERWGWWWVWEEPSFLHLGNLQHKNVFETSAFFFRNFLEVFSLNFPYTRNQHLYLVNLEKVKIHVKCSEYRICCRGGALLAWTGREPLILTICCYQINSSFGLGWGTCFLSSERMPQ